jgi:ribose-phosphate pyrophosphokinase
MRGTHADLDQRRNHKPGLAFANPGKGRAELVPPDILLFALGDSARYARRVAAALAIPLGGVEEREFEDGEHKARPLNLVRRRNVYVLHALHGDPQRSPNDKLCQLLFFVGALKDAGAARVTVVAPYLCYGRKDQQTKLQDPVTTKYVATLFEAVGTDRIMTLDVHNQAAFQNAFRIPVDNLEARSLFVDHFARYQQAERVIVLSPDIGGTKRAEHFRRELAVYLVTPPLSGFMEKRRSDGQLSGDQLVGRVRDRNVILYDDLISTGTTLLRAAKACREAGAARVYAAATHGLFVNGAQALAGDPLFDEIIVTDTIPPFRAIGDNGLNKITVLDSTGLVAAAIRNDQPRGNG